MNKKCYYNFKTNIKFLKLVPLYLLQKPLGYDFHLYGLMPLIGFTTLLVRKKIEKVFIPFLIVFSGSMIFSIYNSDWLSARRSFQTLCMVGFSFYLIIFFTDKEINRLAKNSIYLIIMYYFYDFLFGIKSHVYTLKLIHTNFLPSGILNNMNYTGFLSAGLALYFSVNKDSRHFILACILVFISQSKTAFFCLILSLPIFIVNDRSDNKLRVYAYSIYFIILFYPIILYLIELYSTDDVKVVLNSWSGSRYSIQLSYLDLFFSFPFGVGYDRSHELIGAFINQGSTIVEKGLFKPYFSDIGAHNSYIKVLSELGFLSYCLYFWFIFLILKKSLNFDRYLSVVYMAICASQLWLEGLNEFIVYFWIAVILRSSFHCMKNST